MSAATATTLDVAPIPRMLWAETRAKLLARLSDKRTDTILKAVADEFAKDGIELISSATYLSHLLVPEGAQAAGPTDPRRISIGLRNVRVVPQP